LAYLTRFSLFALVIVMIGAVVFPVVVVQRAATESGRRALLQRGAAVIGLACSALLVPVVGARLYIQLDSLRFPGDPLLQSLGPLLGQTVWGHAWVLQSAATIAAAGGFTMSRSRRLRAPGTLVSLLAVLTLAITLPLSGHAVGGDASRRMLSVAADAAHVLGAGTWIGTLAIMFALVLRHPPSGDKENALERFSLVRAFSPIALACATVVALSGATSGLIHMEGLSDLATTAYGRVLAAKIALVGVVVALGYFNWKRNTPVILSDMGVAIRRGTRRELAVAIMVLLVTAALVVTPPGPEG
jgi:putative copper export protein